VAVVQRFVCRECGRESLRWEGRCPGCDAWNSFDEVERGTSSRRAAGGRSATATPRPLGDRAGPGAARLSVGAGDFDRVLGGGAVEGSVVLLGGAPGIGKSTLLLQAAAAIAGAGAAVLYVSGEESEEQVRRRAARLGEGAARVLFLAETSVDAIVEAAARSSPVLLCVDSIQTTVREGLDSAPGSVSQVRGAADALRSFAKRSGTPTFLVGHVTKGGGIAGPRTLEHLVDVVLHFEGLRGEDARILRATKNRFGRVGELAVSRMSDRGLVEVTDPGRTLLEERAAGPGSALTVTIEGARAVPVEVQALTTGSTQPSPRRMTTGYPARRLAMLLAVLERRGGIPLGRREVFVNVVSGFRITDPGADAGVLAALVSAELDRVLPPTAAFLGEAGLSGELRGIGEREARVRELARMGLTDVLIPARRGTENGDGAAAGVSIHPVSSVRQLIGWVRRHGTPVATEEQLP